MRCWTPVIVLLCTWAPGILGSRGASAPRRISSEARASQPPKPKAPDPQKHPPLFGLGRTPTTEELQKWDIIIGPDGKGLPPGSGTAAEGKLVYQTRCVECHGATGTEGPFDVLVGGRGTLATAKPLKTVGSFWPHATTLWDYVNRAMPFDTPGSLSHDQVYATVAYLLFLNGIVGDHDRLDAKTLPLIKMPNRGGFVPDSRPDVGKKKPGA